MLSVNREKCVGCGLCTDVCPSILIKLDEENKAVIKEKYCMHCLHCAVICPKEAIAYDEASALGDNVRPLTERDVEVVNTVIKQRRSYRKFKEERVDRELVREIIRTADLAASAKNQHPTHWIVVDSISVINHIMEPILQFCKENQVFPEVVAAYKKGNSPVIGKNASILIGYCFEDAIKPACDTVIALTSIELMMQVRKIGTCWAGYLEYFLNVIPECRSMIGLPEGAKVYATLLFGYPNQQDYHHIPSRRQHANIDFV